MSSKREKKYLDALKEIKQIVNDSISYEGDELRLAEVKEVLDNVLEETEVEWPEDLPKYEGKYKKFVEDILRAQEDGEFDAEIELMHYRGRFHYEGPAVVCSNVELQTIYACTDVPLQKDNMAFDWVVYPK